MLCRFYILLFLGIFLTSCEDKNSARQIPESKDTEIKIEPDSILEERDQGVKKEKKANPKGPLLVQTELIPFLTQYVKENPEDKVRIKTRFGDIEVELFQDTPLHRANFIFLVKQEYFDGTYFHRVSPGFVIQGGNSDNPETNQKRHYIGSYLVPSEFDAGHRHVRGAFSAAKYSVQNVSKASSPYEFFIVQAENGAPHLNNDHTVFGRVTKGMAVVDSINKVQVDESEWPYRNIHLQVEIID